MSSRIILILIAAVLMSCSAKRYLPEGERYFAGHEYEYNNEDETVPSVLRDKVEADIRPDPVNKFLGARPAVWLHEIMGEVEKEKGVKHFLKNKIGTKPVYISDVTHERNANYIQSYLAGEGFFEVRVRTEIDSSEHQAKVVYRIEQGTPYRIGEMLTCKNPGRICGKLDSLLRDTDLQEGKLFSRKAMEDAREKMGNHFRSEGYYYFRPDYIRFKADSSNGDRTVKVQAGLTPDIEKGTLKVYDIEEIWVDLSGKSGPKDTLRGRINILTGSERPFIKPEKIEPFIAIDRDAPYSLEDQKITLRQLNRLDVFEFVTLRYSSDSTGGDYALRADLVGTPLQRQGLTAEIDVTTTSNNYTGPGIQLEYTNRNLFRGAEKLRLTGTGRYETQLSGARKGLTSFELNLQADLLVPRRGGLGRDGRMRGNVPRTKYSGRYRIFRQGDFYAQSAIGARYGVEWLSGESHLHDLRFVSVDFLRLLNSSEELDALLGDNPFFRESFENQFIIGPSYSYTYNPRGNSDKRLRHFFNVAVDFSGNVLTGAYSLFQVPFEEEGDYTIGRAPFSQFSRILIDNRLTLKVSRTSELVFRQNIGAGFAYGNSNSMPFSKQFFVGGAMSMRAFQPRAIGPGSYVNPDQVFGSFFDQTGDFLAEFNLEYRFAQSGYFQWAIFTDVGNVWLQDESESRPGGHFEWSRAPSELAVAGGIGFRMDFDIILLRFDLATPLRLPYLPENDRWVIDQFDPLSAGWRGENLLLNIAIGYPF